MNGLQILTGFAAGGDMLSGGSDPETAPQFSDTGTFARLMRRPDTAADASGGASEGDAHAEDAGAFTFVHPGDGGKVLPGSGQPLPPDAAGYPRLPAHAEAMRTVALPTSMAAGGAAPGVGAELLSAPMDDAGVAMAGRGTILQGTQPGDARLLPASAAPTVTTLPPVAAAAAGGGIAEGLKPVLNGAATRLAQVGHVAQPAPTAIAPDTDSDSLVRTMAIDDFPEAVRPGALPGQRLRHGAAPHFKQADGDPGRKASLEQARIPVLTRRAMSVPQPAAEDLNVLAQREAARHMSANPQQVQAQVTGPIVPERNRGSDQAAGAPAFSGPGRRTSRPDALALQTTPARDRSRGSSDGRFAVAIKAAASGRATAPEAGMPQREPAPGVSNLQQAAESTFKTTAAQSQLTDPARFIPTSGTPAAQPGPVGFSDAIGRDVVAGRLHTPVGSERWADALGERVVMMLRGEHQVARLTLNPEHMGPLEVRLKVSDDQAQIWVHAQNPQVRDAIETALPRLREMLAQQGLDLARDQGGGERQPQAQMSGGSDGGNRDNEPVAARGSDAGGVSGDVPADSSGAAGPRGHDGLIDHYA